MLPDMASFAIIAGLMTIVPGLDTALVVRTAIAGGRREGFAAALGVGTGTLAWGAAAAAGVSALLDVSRVAFDALRLAGAAYLLWLGARLLLGSWRQAGREAAEARELPGCRRGVAGAWSRGVATNLLNPKIGVFYMATLPQFVPRGEPPVLAGLALALTHDAEGVVWFAILIAGTHWARRWLAAQRARRLTDRLTGLALIGFGVKLAFSRR